MTDAQKLEALIQRAIEGGYTYSGCYQDFNGKLMLDMKEEQWVTVFEAENDYSIIFNHDFARALFGDTPEYEADLYRPEAYQITLKHWEWHIQQAVTSDNPIDYMYQAVFGGKDEKDKN